MDIALQKHGAKHVYRIPEGLRELCADISREVLRAQPKDIYCFVADYIDALLITRENAKVAVRVVNNIVLGSEMIVDILRQSGLSLEQIAVAASRIQKAFRSYLDIVDVQKPGIYEEKRIDENSRVCIRQILETTGTTWEQAENAASTIQIAFRSHYKEMLAREARGEVQWQRAVINTIAILRKAGVSQEEAARSATLIQSSYRGYYTRRNMRFKILSSTAEEENKRDEDVLEPRETVQAVAWMDMMFQDSRHTIERANEAATTIQSAFRGYRIRAQQESEYSEPSNAESSRSMVVEAILDNLRQRVWGKVKSLEKYPEEYGTREEMEETADKIETEYKNRQRRIKIVEQMKEDEVQESYESIPEERTKAEAVEDFDIAQDTDDGNKQEPVIAAEEFEAVAEIDLKEEKENSPELPPEFEATSEIKTDDKEHEEHESVAAQEPEVKIEAQQETAVKEEQDEHKEHEIKDSNNTEDAGEC